MLLKLNMMHLPKEATSKDRSLKTQVLLAKGDEKTTDTQKIWKIAGFFGDQSTDFTINTANSPGNTLMYGNQGNISPVKGDVVIYLDYTSKTALEIWKITSAYLKR